MKTFSNFIPGVFQEESATSKARIQAKKSKLTAALKRFWQAMITASSEPQIWQTRDRFGHLFWNTYDPITGRSNCFVSKDGVYEWLEQRYYS
jgi:hypothetical protein